MARRCLVALRPLDPLGGVRVGRKAKIGGDAGIQSKIQNNIEGQGDSKTMKRLMIKTFGMWFLSRAA